MSDDSSPRIRIVVIGKPSYQLNRKPKKSCFSNNYRGLTGYLALHSSVANPLAGRRVARKSKSGHYSTLDLVSINTRRANAVEEVAIYENWGKTRLYGDTGSVCRGDYFYHLL
jgi:hypothetical protein